MITARTLVRFVFAGLFVNAMAVACVVSDGNDNDDDDDAACTPGDYKDCTCADGEASQKKCSVSGNGYGACACDGSGIGGSGGSAGEPSTTAGTTNTYGGETSNPAGGAGGDNVGGMTSEGGAGGAGPEDDVCVIDEDDDCQSCIQVDCCDAWTACRADTEGDCESEVLDIKACSQIEKRGVDDEVTPAELEDCAQVIAENDVWSAGVLPTTKAVIDCMAGGTGWAVKDSLEGSMCHSLCFAPEVE